MSCRRRLAVPGLQSRKTGALPDLFQQRFSKDSRNIREKIYYTRTIQHHIPVKPLPTSGSPRVVWVLTGFVAVVATLAIGGWHAGLSAGALEEQKLNHELLLAEHELTESKWQAGLKNSRIGGAPANADSQIAQLRRQVSQLQAESNQYRSQLDANILDRTRNRDLLAALCFPGVQLKALHGTGPTANTIAYILIAPRTKVIFMGSAIPTPPPDREYQLWGLRKYGAALESLGLFTPDADHKVYLVIEDVTLARDFATFTATEEPLGGSVSPSGAKLLCSERP
jgi:hypothetical protein